MGHRVGIDLGTTNSVIAYTERGRQRCAKVDRNEFASAVLPSCVGLLGNGEHAIGAKARRCLEHVAEFKRGIGTDAAFQLGDRLLSPVELSAIVLRRLREGFEAAVGPIDGAVITVPAMFNERQRRETVEAGRLAGLNVLRVINEPSAAAIAYSLSDRPPTENTVVVDWGGGTFDVSLLDCAEDVLDVKANDGDMQLGGKDVDAAVADLIRERLRVAGIDPGDSAQDRLQLAAAAEEVKIHLAENDVWDAPVVLPQRKVVADLRLTRAEFDARIAPLLDRAMAVIARLLTRNPGRALRPQDVRDVIFVGGSCLIPAFRHRVEAMFGHAGRATIDPMEVVALGAAYQAEHASSAADAKLLTIHSLTKNLGVSCMGHDGAGVLRHDLFSCLLKAGTRIPAKHTETYSTVQDDQEAIELRIFELDSLRERVEGKPFDVQEIRGLPKGRAGSFAIQVTFEYSVDQRLTVTVHVPGTGVRRRWMPRHERALADRRPASQVRVDATFGDALEPFRTLADRAARGLGARTDAPRSAAALLALREALESADAEAAALAKAELLSALFDEGVALG